MITRAGYSTQILRAVAATSKAWQGSRARRAWNQPHGRTWFSRHETRPASNANLRPQEFALLQLRVCLLQLFLGVHYNRAVPGYRFLERLPGNQEEANAVLPGLDLDL